MAPGPGIRIGDAEREAAASGLREHFAAGRLTAEEFQQRLDAAFAAKTDLDLAKVTEDLPGTSSYLPPAAPPPNPGWQGPAFPPGDGYHPPRRGPARASAFAGIPLVLFLLLIMFAVWVPLGGLPKLIVIVIAVFAFIRRILRRGGARSRRW